MDFQITKGISQNKENSGHLPQTNTNNGYFPVTQEPLIDNFKDNKLEIPFSKKKINVFSLFFLLFLVLYFVYLLYQSILFIAQSFYL